MFLVSALGARDMGFISASDFLIRVRKTVETLGRVRIFHGHILNWYDTRTLEPQYVSTVDSGNLAVSLIVLRRGCLVLAAKASVDRAWFGCLGTTLDLLAGAIRVLPDHDAPIEHWLSSSRPVTRLQGKPSILSCNGSMFEYLMPPLFLPSYRNTLLGESELTAVDFQRAYAGERGVPWGNLNQPSGPLMRRAPINTRRLACPVWASGAALTEDIVIAPYRSALALCGWPEAAADNLARLATLGAMTRWITRPTGQR